MLVHCQSVVIDSSGTYVNGRKIADSDNGTKSSSFHIGNGGVYINGRKIS